MGTDWTVKPQMTVWTVSLHEGIDLFKGWACELIDLTGAENR